MNAGILSLIAGSGATPEAAAGCLLLYPIGYTAIVRTTSAVPEKVTLAGALLLDAANGAGSPRRSSRSVPVWFAH